jgi:general secretion pathway protein L
MTGASHDGASHDRAMTAASQPAHPVRRLAAWAGVRRFLAWWSDELSDLAAIWAAPARAWTVMLLRRERGCEVYLRTREGIEHVGTSTDTSMGMSTDTGDRPFEDLRRRLGRQQVAAAEIVLRLQPGEVVQTRLSVPAGAGDVLEPIVRNQIERLAPWPADKALFAYRIAASKPGSSTLDIELAIAGRNLIDGLVAELGAAGLAPGVVDYGTDPVQEPSINLLAAHSEAGRRSGRRLLAAVGLVLAAALLAGAIGVAMLIEETRGLGGLGARLQQLEGKAAAELPSQTSLRRQAWLMAQRGSQASMAIVLEALSRALPDEAWLDRLEVEQGSVRLAGQAANAAALIGRIEASGHFAEVRFAAPTTLSEEDNRESFTIGGRIVPGRTLER